MSTGDVFRLFHDHHDERDEYVEGGDEDDESDSDEGDQALQAERVEEGFVLFFPVGGHETFAGGVFEGARDGGCLVDVVDFEFHDRDQVAQAEQLLCVGEAGEGPTRVVIEEAGTENSDDAETVVLGDHAEGREFTLRAGNENDRSDGRAEIVGHVFAEHDGRHGSGAFFHRDQRIWGGICLRGTFGLG